ncbi:dual specificity protein kinase CLK2-like isoform X1 [Synchiropus splendidus]|uniref:dual specificity protein kinase CLK2-like isoform X1 n=2 Tax=Synchiropus splendidus TaxID=270530 RepID=UPI00237D5FA2|nr:dual specificity protein kinase CLK2-like isoform X1 [Synchiropus splendidus]
MAGHQFCRSLFGTGECVFTFAPGGGRGRGGGGEVSQQSSRRPNTLRADTEEDNPSNSSRQRLDRGGLSAATDTSEASDDMGLEDNDFWIVPEPHSDLHTDRESADFSHVSSEDTERSSADKAVSDGDDGAPKSEERKSCEDDEEGHLVYHVGLLLKDRYEVVSLLGAGAFGKVLECIDRHKDERVAVKVVRNIECFTEVAKSEIAVLEEINGLDDDNRFACVRMLDWFQHEGHVCMVFERLGLSTFEFLRQNQYLPFSVEQIRHMAFQIFRAVCFLHRNKLTHTDLKPENILLVCSDYELEYDRYMRCEQRKLKQIDVKVVDFGTATFDHQHHESLVSTRHYRAPEVILDLGWNQSCDVWSLACVLMEYYLGRTLFPTHDSKEHLAMMERVLGPIPPHLLKQTRKQQYVSGDGRLDWDESSKSDDYVRKHCKPLKQYLQRASEDERQLLDLISCMLEYDVCRRITLEEALWHPFFSPMRTQKKQQRS